MNVVKTLPFRDILEVTEAVSHIINVLDVSEIQNALMLFCMPVAEQLNALVQKPRNVITKEEQTKAGGKYKNIMFGWMDKLNCRFIRSP